MKSLVEFLTEAKKVDIQNLLNKNPKDIYIDGEDLVIGDKTVAEFWDDGGIDFPKGTDPEVAKAVIDQWIKNTGNDWPEEGDIYIMIDGKEINEKQESSKANLNESNDIPKILKQLLKKYKKADDVYQDGSDLVFGMEGHTVAELSDDGGVIFPEGTDPDDAIAVVKLWTSKKSKVRPTYDDIEYIMVGDTEIKK